METIAKEWRKQVEFYLNGRKVIVKNPNPTEFLLSYLRKNGLTGTKYVCGEGACGACTVVLTRFSHRKGGLEHLAVNACLYPLCAVDGCAVTTVEALGTSDNMHEIQKAIADAHGSQCGFCTPGFEMAVAAYRSEHPDATPDELELALDGNICRCTGYRPIVQAVRSLGKCDGKGGCGCGKNGDIEDCAAKKNHVFSDVKALRNDFGPVAVDNGEAKWFAPRSLQEVAQLKEVFPKARLLVGSSEIGVEMRARYTEPECIVHVAHVPELNEIRVDEAAGLEIGGSVSLTDVHDFIAAEAKKFPEWKFRSFQAIRKVLEIFACRQVRNVACIAGNIATSSPTSDLCPILLATGATVHVVSTKGSRVVEMKNWFHGYRKTELAADEVIVKVVVPFTKENEYVVDYKTSRRKEDDIHLCNACFRVEIEGEQKPWTVPEVKPVELVHYINPLLGDKEVSKELAEHAEKAEVIFNPPSLCQIPCKDSPVTYKVAAFTAAFGSLNVHTALAPSVATLVGHTWTDDIVQLIWDAIEKDLPLAQNTVGGLVDYRRATVKSLAYKFFLEVAEKLYGQEAIPEATRKLFPEHVREPTHGTQVYDERPLTDSSAVGASIKHLSADKQAAGEAVFVDDVAPVSNEGYGAVFRSTRPHARILNIDLSAALAFPGVIAIYTAKDIPGKNVVEAHPGDEELFASEIVKFVGQPIGIIVAESSEIAHKAALLVKVEYEDLEAILTIKEAIEKKSFGCDPFVINRGDLDAGFASADYVIDGEVVTEGQDQFYLETQSCIAYPSRDGDIEILSSTQNPTLAQKSAADVLGLPHSKVVCRIRRAGGGFGGKESRSVPVSSAAALAAFKLKRPVRIVQDRGEDMPTHGTRHPFYNKYRVGFNKDGKIVAYDVDIYNNAGHSVDLSIAILHRALFHVDNAYKIPNIRCTGRICMTNRPSNTAYRGFGGPQGMLVIENIIERMAKILNMEPSEIRTLNMYREGEQTHYDKVLENSQLERCWQEALQTSEYLKRKAEIEKENAANRWVKRGIAAVPVKFGLSFTHRPLNQAGALVHVYTDGSVLVAHGACEIGQGINTKLAQVAATALRIPISKIQIGDTTTDKVPNTSATAASMQADLNGMAVLDACMQIRKRLDDFVAANAAQRGNLSWEELCNLAYEERIDLSAHGFYTAEFGFDWKTQKGKVFAYYSYGAAVCEVVLDVLTGEHHVTRADVVMDLGKSLNPALDVGQIEGAFMQGMGWSTTEQIVCLKNGRQFTLGPGTYKVPTPGDIPVEMNISLLRNSSNPYAVYSSKGIGEPPLFLGCSSFFALKHAVDSARADVGIEGYMQMTLPATVERLRLACRDAFTDPPGIHSNDENVFIEEYPCTKDLLEKL